jgi:hypothetical protein
MVQSFTWRSWNEATAPSTEQRSGRPGFFSCEGFPQGCTVLVAATGDLRGYGLPALGCGKLLELSVQENSWLERNLFLLTGCPLGVMRLCADDMLDELDGGAAGRKLC